MKIIYDIESDILMFKLSQAAPVDAIEEPGVLLSVMQRTENQYLLSS